MTKPPSSPAAAEDVEERASNFYKEYADKGPRRKLSKFYGTDVR